MIDSKEEYINGVLSTISTEDKQKVLKVITELAGGVHGDIDRFPTVFSKLDNAVLHALITIFRHVGKDRNVPRLFEMLDAEIIRRRDGKIDDILKND